MEKELGHPMPGSADSCGYLDRAWLPKEELPVETGSGNILNFSLILDLRLCEASEVPQSAA